MKIAIAVLTALLLTVSGPTARAWENFGGPWVGGFHPAGATVTIDYFADSCPLDFQPQMEFTIRYFVSLMSRTDTTRTWVYAGRRASTGWLQWDDGVTTVECMTPSQPIGGNLGMGLPVQDSSTTPQTIRDGAAVISTANRQMDVGWVTLHELGHAVLTMDHSTTAGATMMTGAFDTPFSAQLRETFSRDDYCGIEAKYAELGQTIEVNDRPIADDQTNVYVPYIEWQGLEWEFWLTNQDGVLTVTALKLLADCSALEN